MTSEPGSERPSDGERGGGQAPVDPDVDLHIRSDRIETRARRWDVLAAIAIGGVLGSEARHGIGVALPHPADAMPWATFLINVSGCALIGVLMVTITELTRCSESVSSAVTPPSPPTVWRSTRCWPWVGPGWP